MPFFSRPASFFRGDCILIQVYLSIYLYLKLYAVVANGLSGLNGLAHLWKYGEHVMAGGGVIRSKAGRKCMVKQTNNDTTE
jgi:hypothetical protein